jgi:hypothetical protein
MKKITIIFTIIFITNLLNYCKAKAYTDPTIISTEQLQTALNDFKSRIQSNFYERYSNGVYYYVIYRATGQDENNASGAYYCYALTKPYKYWSKASYQSYMDYPLLQQSETGIVAYMMIKSTGSYTLPTSIYSQSIDSINMYTDIVVYSSDSIMDNNGVIVHNAVSLSGDSWGLLKDVTPIPTVTSTPVSPTPTPTSSGDNTGLITGLLDGIKNIFIPKPEYFTDKINQIKERFLWTNSVVQIFNQTIGSLVSSDNPPVVKIKGKEGTVLNFDEVVLMDFSWYEPYRITINNLLSAIIYMFYFYALYKRLPDIIAGAGMVTIYDSKIQDYTMKNQQKEE